MNPDIILHKKSSSSEITSKMIQFERLQSSWPYYNIIDSSLNEACTYNPPMDVHMADCEISSSFSTGDFFDNSSIPCFSTINSDVLLMLPIYGEDVQVMFPPEQSSSLYYEELSPVSNNQLSSDEIEDLCRWMEESESGLPTQHTIEEEDEGSLSPSTTSIESVQPSLVLPQDYMEVNNQLSILHLLKAYGEAMENKQAELAEVIVRRIREKVGPSGTIVERLGYHLFQALDNQGDYLKQESSKNYEAAFRACYQMFPYGKFAHLTANSAILEAVPEDADSIHIVDFDMGEGVQWPSLIEALGCQRAVRLTSIRWKEDHGFVHPQWPFQETKRQLYNHAQSLGLKLRVEEMDMENLVSEIRKTKQTGRGREFLAFNCMVGLPHMGRGRSRRQVMEFLKEARELITNPLNRNNNGNGGIITFGDGDGDDVEERMRNCCRFGSFFDRHLVHFNALLESMEGHFPIHLTEGRIAMECLFVAPFASSLACYRRWEEIKDGYDLYSEFGFQSRRMSKQNLVEAKEIVREGESLYGVRVEGENENEMVLEWRGTPLVRVSTWR